MVALAAGVGALRAQRFLAPGFPTATIFVFSLSSGNGDRFFVSGVIYPLIAWIGQGWEGLGTLSVRKFSQSRG